MPELSGGMLAGDGIAGRGPSYGIPTIRVDGGDARAVYNATLEARAVALEHSCPVLIEVSSQLTQTLLLLPKGLRGGLTLRFTPLSMTSQASLPHCFWQSRVFVWVLHRDFVWCLVLAVCCMCSFANVLNTAHTALTNALSMQAMSYRSGHHSTSDDSSRYRTAEEMQEWRARDPVTRFQAFLDEAGWWDLEQEKGLRIAVRKEVRPGSPAQPSPLVPDSHRGRSKDCVYETTLRQSNCVPLASLDNGCKAQELICCDCIAAPTHCRALLAI